ncbi:MAG: CopG family transcriptional regulator [Eubacteriales bacterium]
MSPRTGRPKAEEPKNTEAKTKIDEKTNEKLKAYCESHNISRSEAVRNGIHLLLEKE